MTYKELDEFRDRMGWNDTMIREMQNISRQTYHTRRKRHADCEMVPYWSGVAMKQALIKKRDLIDRIINRL